MGCLDDITEVVNSSAQWRYLQLVATQDGETIVTTYDWANLFIVTMKMPGI